MGRDAQGLCDPQTWIEPRQDCGRSYSDCFLQGAYGRIQVPVFDCHCEGLAKDEYRKAAKVCPQGTGVEGTHQAHQLEIDPNFDNKRYKTQVRKVRDKPHWDAVILASILIFLNSNNIHGLRNPWWDLSHARPSFPPKTCFAQVVKNLLTVGQT